MLNFLTFFLLFSFSSFAQEDLESLEKTIEKDRVLQNLSDQAKGISLNDAIEEGLRKNNKEVLRKYQFQLNQLDYDDAFEEFWFPKLNLTMQTNDDHFTENLYRDGFDNAQSSNTPNGFVGLEMPDYTLFNWGRDYLEYLNSQEAYKRNKQIFQEQRRELRFNIIMSYFNLVRLNQITKAYKKQLSHTSFIYKLAKEKLGLKKIRTQEYLQAKAIFLRTHKNYQNSLFEYYNQQQVFAKFIGDDPGTIYKPQDSLKYKPISIGKNESLRSVIKNSPQIKNALSLLQRSDRSYQKTLKDNMPLPKLSLKLGSYQRQFSTSGANDNYETFTGSKNLEVAATVNMTWTIFGSGGLFNSRTTKRSYYQKRIAEMNLKEAQREMKVANGLTHSRIIYLEKKHAATQAQLKNARKVFDQAIDNYIDSKSSFADMKNVLEELIESNTDIENVKYEHLVEKLTYALVMGVDDFPGEKFENLVEK
jgi:outer membrane protein TolC